MTYMLIDRKSVERMILRTSKVIGDTHRYYVSKYERAIVVTRYGLFLSELIDHVVAVSIGWDRVESDFVLGENKRRAHSQCTIYTINDEYAATWTLADFLNQAPNDVVEHASDPNAAHLSGC